MLGIIRYHLAHITDVTGRDARPTFWWYVLMVTILQIAVGMAATIPMMTSTVMGAIDAAQAGISEAQMEAQMLGKMSTMLERSMWVSMGANVLATALLLAGFVRRLHDTGRAGWWALIPVATLAVSSWMALDTIEQLKALFANATSMTEVQNMQSAAMQGNMGGLISWAGLILAAVLAALKSNDGPNQYGDAPVAMKP